MVPTECKYCGCEEVATKTDSEIVFRCWSSYVVEDHCWNVSNNCGARCAVQLVELRERVQQHIEFMKAREANVVTALKSRLRTLNERVQRAVEVLEGSYRIIMVFKGDNENVVFATDVDRAIEILEGEEDDDINSPESPDSSPITTDDLAASDYFEAVRQRVPWMVTIEHIEELVEGYRQCGVMVWKAAKHIQRVHGGEYGKAD